MIVYPWILSLFTKLQTYRQVIYETYSCKSGRIPLAGLLGRDSEWERFLAGILSILRVRVTGRLVWVLEFWALWGLVVAAAVPTVDLSESVNLIKQTTQIWNQYELLLYSDIECIRSFLLILIMKRFKNESLFYFYATNANSLLSQFTQEMPY